MGCQICKPSQKKNSRKHQKVTFAKPAKASSANKSERQISRNLSINDLREAFRIQKYQAGSNRRGNRASANQESSLEPSKFIVKKIPRKTEDPSAKVESNNRRKIIEDFREFKRNGFDMGNSERRKRKPKSTFLKDYDVLLHKRINSSSFKSKEFLKVMPSSFLERSKQLGSTVISAEMVENELRRSASSRKGRQRYYKLGGNRYDTFKKSHFKRTFELSQLKKIDSLMDFNFLKVSKDKLKGSSSTNRLTSKSRVLGKKKQDQRSRLKKRRSKSKAELRKFKSMVDLGQNFTLNIKNRLTKKSIPEKLKAGGAKPVTDSESTKKANTENTKDEHENRSYSSYEDSDGSSNLEEEAKRMDHMTLQSFGDFGEECEIIGLEGKGSSDGEDSVSSDVHKTLTNLDEVDEELEESAKSRKLQPMEDDYSSESSELYQDDDEQEEDERDRRSNMTLEQEFLSSGSSASDEEDDDVSSLGLENLDSVVGDIDEDQQIESSFDIDVPLNSEDSMYQGDFALKLD